ncbi:hypothetical protein FRC01_008781 [Tulasnella sp. 417]|nr:hypothetical protein FRC01_008781 [Tulasnella sp. 417]
MPIPCSNSRPSADPTVTITTSERKTEVEGDHDMTDQEVWEMADEEIVAAHRKRWQSDVYNHFNITIKRETTDSGSRVIRFAFTCKYGNSNHPVQHRNRLGDGSTGNLTKRSQTCDQQRLTSSHSTTLNSAVSTAAKPTYDLYRHRTLIALRCARYHRPFNMVEDEEYKMEVALLNPDASIPSAKTVSRDTQKLWTFTSTQLAAYFSTYTGVIHVAVDGWTSPIIFSYMGIVVIWYANGKIWRATLDLSRLKSSHTGQNMARHLYDTLHAFGLLRFLFSIVLDNASNCDTLVKALQSYHPDFPGMIRRIRCWPHVVNLIARAFLAVFFLAIGTAAKKTPTLVVAPVRPGSKRKRSEPASASAEHSTPIEDPVEREMRGLFPVAEEEPVDPGRALHDQQVVAEALSAAEDAIKTKRPVTLTTNTEEERAMAGRIFPKVTGLARRVHDTSTLKEKFDNIVKQDIKDRKLNESKTSLSRRVATLWNSDLHCLRDHIYFKRQVKQLIAQEPSLDEFNLSDQEWKLAEEVAEVLVVGILPLLPFAANQLTPTQIFEDPTLLFSQSEVPLIHEVHPMMDELVLQLHAVQNQEGGPLHEVTVTAAKAALAVAEKYQKLSAELMCPDKKLDYFSNREPAALSKLRQDCISRFNSTFGSVPPGGPSQTASMTAPVSSSSTPAAPQSQTSSADSGSPAPRRWTVKKTPSYTSVDNMSRLDTMEGYLSEPLVLTDHIVAAGGVLQWWEIQRKVRPHLAAMALAYLTAPGNIISAADI